MATTETDKIEQERERFEAWWDAPYAPPFHADDELAWQAWQARAALDTGAVPTGWKLVPVEPTFGLDAMSGAGAEQIPAEVGRGEAGRMACEIYRAMLVAAPQPPASANDDVDLCSVCADPIREGDTCATDIEMGTCHAACLEGSPVVDLHTGEPSEGPVTTFIREGEVERVVRDGRDQRQDEVNDRLSTWSPAPSAFQASVADWMSACFGAEISADKVERGDRLLEEVLELLQSVGYPRERIRALEGYVYSRPVGEPHQEVGGVMVTLAAFCGAHGLDMAKSGEAELARIWTKLEAIRAKQAAKPTGSALPQAWPEPAHPDARQAAEEMREACATRLLAVADDGGVTMTLSKSEKFALEALRKDARITGHLADPGGKYGAGAELRRRGRPVEAMQPEIVEALASAGLADRRWEGLGRYVVTLTDAGRAALAEGGRDE